MSAGADYAIGAPVSWEAAVSAFAHAYGLPTDRVAVLSDAMLPWPDAEVILHMVGNGHLPGDYPTQIVTWDGDDRTPDAIARGVAIALGVPILTGADTDDPQDMHLHLPDGTTHRVSVMQDDDDGIRNTPEMRRLIATAQGRLSAARAA